MQIFTHSYDFNNRQHFNVVIDEPYFPNFNLGYDMDVFDAGLIKMFYDYVKSIGGPASTVTPIESAIVNNKKFVMVR
jgi:hypothetical protein